MCVVKSESKRLFLGLKLEDKVGPSFHQMFRKLKTSADQKELNIKWTPLRNLHLTLKFLGDVPTDRVAVVQSVARELALQLPPVSLRFRGLGGFPDEFGARVLWLGVAHSNTLQGVQKNVEEAFVREGFSARDETFIPHITLARLRTKKNIRDLISPFVRKEFGKWDVDKIVLFESHIQGGFTQYTPLEEFELKGRPEK